jgi:hypothetical protein
MINGPGLDNTLARDWPHITHSSDSSIADGHQRRGDNALLSCQSGEEPRYLSDVEVGCFISHGFCFAETVNEKFRSDPPHTIDDFTRAMFVAEGLNPELVRRSVYRQVRGV